MEVEPEFRLCNFSPLFSVFFFFNFEKSDTDAVRRSPRREAVRVLNCKFVRVCATLVRRSRKLFSTVPGLPTETQRDENYCTPNTRMWCKYSNLNVQRVVHSSCELAFVADMESQQRAALRITGWTHAYAASCSAAALESPKRPAARANSMMRKGRRTRNRGAAGARGLRWGVPANASSLCGVCAGGSSARVGETCGGVASGEAPAEAVCGESHCA